MRLYQRKEDDLRKVIQLANLDNFISSLPLGIQTIVGERFETIRWEKQRGVAEHC